MVPAGGWAQKGRDLKEQAGGEEAKGSSLTYTGAREKYSANSETGE